MSASRPVRIARSSGGSASSTPPERVKRADLQIRPNRAGTQRAIRLSALYVALLTVLYATFALIGRSAPGGTGSAGADELAIFSIAAVVLAVVGVVFTFTPVPRAVVPREDGFLIIGRWGRRSDWSPLDEITIHRVRRYSPGLLASGPVDSVELSRDGRGRKSYLIEAGLLPEPPGRDRRA